MEKKIDKEQLVIIGKKKEIHERPNLSVNGSQIASNPSGLYQNNNIRPESATTNASLKLGQEI